ncbi:MAG: Crp/Fnr family transcriptional regulator [Candidatus Eisenbacteria bacterium]|nr:Crp/Fnr family transcriptional regulator [Candidatus Eisenbacteria bacterium]
MTRRQDSGKKIPCAVCDMRKNGLLSRVEERLLERVEGAKVIHRFGPRQVIFHEGTPPLAVYCLRAGRVKLYRSGKRGEEVVLRVLGPGAAFGYRPLLCEELYAVTAESIEESEVCVLPRQVLTDLLRDSPSFAIDLLARIARELRYSEDQLLDLTQKSVLERTSGLLVMFLENCGEKTDGGIRLAIPIQRKEMAQMVGTTPETFSRTLHELAERGIIVLSRSDIVVRDEAALRQAVGE